MICYNSLNRNHWPQCSLRLLWLWETHPWLVLWTGLNSLKRFNSKEQFVHESNSVTSLINMIAQIRVDFRLNLCLFLTLILQLQKTWNTVHESYRSLLWCSFAILELDSLSSHYFKPNNWSGYCYIYILTEEKKSNVWSKQHEGD